MEENGNNIVQWVTIGLSVVVGIVAGLLGLGRSNADLDSATRRIDKHDDELTRLSIEMNCINKHLSAIDERTKLILDRLNRTEL